MVSDFHFRYPSSTNLNPSLSIHARVSCDMIRSCGDLWTIGIDCVKPSSESVRVLSSVHSVHRTTVFIAYFEKDIAPEMKSGTDRKR